MSSPQDKFVLYTIDGDFSLPSIDTECLQTILYTTIAKIPVQIRLLNNVKNCLLYSAPTFVHKNLQFKSFEETVLYLKTLNYNLDKDLTPMESSQSLALTNLVQAKFKPVLDYVYWLEQRNCDTFTRLWYIKALPTPFNHFAIKRLHNNANILIETLYPDEPNLEVIKDYINTLATECLQTLSMRLGTNDYYFGSKPSKLDVIVYSHLAGIIKLPFPTTDIANLVNMWPNLVAFLKRIDAKFMPEKTRESKYLKFEEKTKNDDDEVSYVAVTILTVSAVSLVLGFAFSRGFLGGGLD